MSAGDDRSGPNSPLTGNPEPAVPEPAQEPPASVEGRETEWVADHDTQSRDTTPALGTPGEPASWQRARPDASVALQRPGWADAAWSFLYGADTGYAGEPASPGDVAEANRRGRTAELGPVHGPLINPPVWTWEVPLYFWFGGMAAGASFVALACDLAGDHRSARIARRVALGAVLPSPPLLIADLGRPGRFLNMLRIFKPRSPMNTGAWSLAVFSALGAAAVGADHVGLRRTARAAGGVNAVVGGYLGSYTGVLLATTAVPVWARSRLFLGPLFVCTGAATGAAATRLTLIGAGLPEHHPTRTALGTIETGAMMAEFGLSLVNERRLGRAGEALGTGGPGQLFRLAQALAATGLGLRFARRRYGAEVHHVASACYLGAGLAFRYAWVGAGRASAMDHEAVARMARGAVTVEDRAIRRGPGHRLESAYRRPLPLPGKGLYTDGIRRLSLLAESLLRRR